METTVSEHMSPYEARLDHAGRVEECVEQEKHIDPEGEHEDWVREDLRDAYEDAFGESIDRYNAKQTREDRKLDVDKYMESIVNDKRGQHVKSKRRKVSGVEVKDAKLPKGGRLCYEWTIQVGGVSEKERDAEGHIVYDENGHEKHPRQLPTDLCKTIYRRYYKHIEDEYVYPVINEETGERATQPVHLKPVLVSYHNDEFFLHPDPRDTTQDVREEGQCHIHICGILLAHGGKTGLDVKNSPKKALQEMGFRGFKGEKNGHSHYYSEYELFNLKEQQVLEQITLDEYKKYCKKHPDFYEKHGDLEIVHPVKGNEDAGNLSPAEYREMMERQRKADTRIQKARQAEEEADQHVEACRMTVEQMHAAYDEIRRACFDAQELQEKATHDLRMFEEWLAAKAKRETIQSEVRAAFGDFLKGKRIVTEDGVEVDAEAAYTDYMAHKVTMTHQQKVDEAKKVSDRIKGKPSTAGYFAKLQSLDRHVQAVAEKANAEADTAEEKDSDDTQAEA